MSYKILQKVKRRECNYSKMSVNFFRVVPFGATNAYSMPIDISLWGRQENQETVMNKLRLHGFTGYTPTYQESIPSSSMGYLTPKRTFLSPAEVSIFKISWVKLNLSKKSMHEPKLLKGNNYREKLFSIVFIYPFFSWFVFDYFNTNSDSDLIWILDAFYYTTV